MNSKKNYNYKNNYDYKKNESKKIYIEYTNYKELKDKENTALEGQEVILIPHFNISECYIHKEPKGDFYIFDKKQMKESLSYEDKFKIIHSKDWEKIKNYFSKDVEITAEANYIRDRFLIHDMYVNKVQVYYNHFLKVLEGSEFRKPLTMYEGKFDKAKISNILKKDTFQINVNVDYFILKSKYFVPYYDGMISIKIEKGDYELKVKRDSKAKSGTNTKKL